MQNRPLCLTARCIRAQDTENVCKDYQIIPVIFEGIVKNRIGAKKLEMGKYCPDCQKGKESIVYQLQTRDCDVTLRQSS